MKILVASDGSKPSLHAVKYAIKLLQSLSSSSNSITLVGVHDDVGLRNAKAFFGRAEVADYLHKLSQTELKSSRKVLDSSGVDYKMELRTGHIAEQIIDVAKKGRFDLIVLGAKGRNAIADLLLGSVAQRVLAVADMPVVLVK